MTLPVQIEYIVKQSMPKDGKLLAIGHSMGGILLYSMLSRFGEFIASLVLIGHCHVAFICYCIFFFCVLCLTFVMVQTIILITNKEGWGNIRIWKRLM